MEEMKTIAVTINRKRLTVDVPAQMSLLELLRERLGLTGTKEGCANGECGACTVIMNGEALRSCIVLAVEADGGEVTTIEGLSEGDRLDPVQQAFIDADAVQCGFCTPGYILAVRALLDRNPNPTAEDTREALSGHLCRCTGYEAIFEAIHRIIPPAEPESE
jgi:carbon-monoxide dehydrogenase small subunit